MAKGYWIVRVDVKNVEGMKQYASGNPPIFKKFGGRYLVRSDNFEVPEGTSRARHGVDASALACYRSPEYQTNIKVREPHAVVDLVIVEGYDGPQP
jgi:uncharacterized protein (DUF1330 family)